LVSASDFAHRAMTGQDETGQDDGMPHLVCMIRGSIGLGHPRFSQLEQTSFTNLWKSFSYNRFLFQPLD